jgi:phytoene/squalene synthetase
LGIKVFESKYRQPIYDIYGFVRFADEIVDTYKGPHTAYLLEKFRRDTFEAIDHGVSFNPILQSFQQVVNEYNIDHHLIDAFMDSMAMDLDREVHDPSSYKQYIYGSAEVVGLMCLHVFVGGDKEKYQSLVTPACALGSAFQKVNFLRDIKSDYVERGRVYFPDVDMRQFSEEDKKKIEADIQAEFDLAYTGIVQLPKGVRFGVMSAYRYYLSLFQKIKNNPASTILNARVRIPNRQKILLLTETALKNSFNLL